MITAVLVDDEKMALEQLQHVLGQYQEIEVLATFTNPLEALREINNIKPGVVFLDIEMPVVNGFVLAEEIKKILPGTSIVFVTGFDDYAIHAFEINAIDYILKPVSGTRIGKTIQRVLDYHGHDRVNKPENSGFETKLERLFKQNMSKVLVWEGDNIIVLDPGQVLFFTFADRSVLVKTEQGVYKTRQTLYYWEERLSELNFFRCHRSYLVNLDKVEKIITLFNNNIILKLMDCSDEIPVSRKNINSLKQILGLV